MNIDENIALKTKNKSTKIKFINGKDLIRESKVKRNSPFFKTSVLCILAKQLLLSYQKYGI